MTVTAMRQKKKAVQLRCSGCGVTVDAACDCNVGYVPAGVIAAKAIKAHPEKSNHAIAKDTGISEYTIRGARKSVTIKNVTDRRIGKDGKNYPATKPRLTIVPDVPEDDDQTIWHRGIVNRAQIAAGDALYEDWSKFEADKELVSLAKQAAKAWSDLASYLETLIPKRRT